MKRFHPLLRPWRKRRVWIHNLQMQSNERKKSAEKWKQEFQGEKLEREKAELENKRLRKEILDLEQRLC